MGSHDSPLTGARVGSVRFGHFDQPIGAIRAADHQLRSPMGGLVTAIERDAAFRSFQFMGAVADGLAAGCAVTHTNAGTSAFAYLWHDNTFTELRIAGREGDHSGFAADPDAGLTALVTARGTVRMSAIAPGRKQLTVESDRLSIDLTFDDDRDVLRLCTPTGPTGWAYVQKTVATPAQGTASTAGTGSTAVDFGDSQALAHHDYTTGFLRPETWWHWACVAARLNDGRRLGLNLSCGTNESGYRENGGWLEGTWFPLDGAIFDFDPDDIESPWAIVGTDGRFEITFETGHGYHAHGESERMSSNFHQLFGAFDGWLDTDDGERLRFRGLPGFTESQYLRW